MTKVTLTVRLRTETISRVNPLCKTLLLLCAIFAPACTFAQTNLNAPRLFELGMDALMGIGPGRDTVAAMDYFRKSADLGYPPAQISLGYYYETGGLLSVDPALALDWYKKAAKQDDRVADWILGRLYFTGQGTPRDLNQAQVVLQRSANQEIPLARIFWVWFCSSAANTRKLLSGSRKPPCRDCRRLSNNSVCSTKTERASPATNSRPMSGCW